MFLIGNVQTYLQSDTVKAEREFRKNLQDTEQWMSRKFLPKNLRKQIRQSELYRWQITRGFDDETLLRKLPKDLRMKIKRHLCLESLRRVPLFEVMDDQFMDAMCDCLKPVLYTEKTQILTEGDPVDTMFFFISGELLCLTDDGLGPYSLKAGDFCGEELLTWALNPNSSTLNFPLSERTVQVFTEVEAFSLKADDMKSVTLQFPMLRNKLRHLFRLYSKQWRTWAACYIQAAWRRYKRKQERSRWEEKYKLQGGLDQNAESSPGFGITIYESRFVARKTAYNADSEIRGT